ncbi:MULTISPECIES: acyltransferase family protein [Sphingobacterium]|uniref:acyltransferase family protein n=1 Tax=Sphingobacterium TaxID=28453 RepID=UPI001049DA0F|nr:MULTISPECIES: acyltransferase [Sphingobacterium]MCW2262809.1 peptidoglycan/LPS O-acetylase OafA/YrhL [Sphingobacterium kitahiroshimense]TCR12198.1 peptidoglycan/LPS O-acetylase OafA/YrhL [Sphingobacterium sp. JUb78]
MYKNISFFPNLNAFRFFAALLVLFHHGEVIRTKNDFITYEHFSFFQNGTTAVKFFFVLSGFLISYLLLKEQDQKKTISIKNFYLKRVIRIWPLYFLLVAIGIVIFPFLFQVLHINYSFPYTIGQVWLLFVLFLPSIVTFTYGSHLLEPLWSIGVEEWFYIIWAPLFKWIDNKFALIIGIFLLKILLLILCFNNIITDVLVVHLIKTFAFESMAIGALGAYFLYHTNINLQAWYKKYAAVNYFLLAVLFSFLFFRNTCIAFIGSNIFDHWIFSYIILNALFLNLILFIGIRLNSKSFFNNTFLDYGGKISYGIYMYHMIVIFAVIHLAKKHLLTLDPYLSFLIFYSLVIAGTFITAHLSKKYFEDFFMKFRSKLN